MSLFLSFSLFFSVSLFNFWFGYNLNRFWIHQVAHYYFLFTIIYQPICRSPSFINQQWLHLHQIKHAYHALIVVRPFRLLKILMFSLIWMCFNFSIFLIVYVQTKPSVWILSAPGDQGYFSANFLCFLVPTMLN